MEADSLDLESLDEEELRQIALSLQALSNQTSLEAITTDDELHQWIIDNLGIDIPRVSVCPDHDAPFEFIADLFFEREDAVLVMASRGAGKSYLAGLWNFLNAYWKPGAECLTVGAQDIQSKRVYSHIKQFQTRAAKDKILTSTITETLWGNGSKVEIITGSFSSVNGPHSQKVHRDEIELMDKGTFQESLQIERAKVVDGKTITSQTLLTSTRKTSQGLMQQLLDECEQAEKEGRKAPYKVYKFCVKECVQNQSHHCRVANPNLPEDKKCDCNLIQKGEWKEGKPRTFDTICQGQFAKSEGFIPLDDVQKTFIKSSKAIWEAQQECKRPYIEDVSLENFSREKNGIKGFELDPENGPIYQGVDFGGTNPHAVEWGQILDYEIIVSDFAGDEMRLPQGSLVVFYELYQAEIGNGKLADMIVEVERQWKRKFPKFRVQGRFADPQAKAARLDFRQHDPPLVCSWPIVTRDREEHFKALYDRIEDGLFFVSLDQCPMLIEEIEAWNINVKEFDHATDACLYMSSNIRAAEKKRDRSKKTHVPTHHKKITVGKPNPFNDHLPGASARTHQLGTQKQMSKWD